MNKIYSIQIPQIDLPHYFRLLSNNGVSYFTKNDNCSLDKSMIDKFDLPIRILADFLIKIDVKIGPTFCGIDTNKESLKELWNNIKREEKVIRKDGLILKKFNGESVVFLDPEYRVYWPSFESFVHEYPLSAKNAWLSIDIPLKMDQQIGIIKTRHDMFRALITSEKIGDYERITFVIDNGDLLSSFYDWRRITETIVSIFSVSEEIIV